MTINPKRPRQSFKKYPMNRAKAAQIFSREKKHSGGMLFRKFIWGKRGNNKEVVQRGLL